jgi:hypothetical protein
MDIGILFAKYCDVKDLQEPHQNALSQDALKKLITEYESNRLEKLVMQWRARDEEPLPNKRILMFAPIYPEESGMRTRIIDSQFFNICREATHWSYISEPSA